MSYFKVEAPAALAAWDEVDAQNKALQKAGREFAALFGGIAVFQYSVTSRWFTGIRINHLPAGHEPQLWTVPTPKTGWSSVPLRNFPRSKSWGVGADIAAIKQQHADLVALWDEKRPTVRVEKEGLLKALGYDWGTLVFAGFEYFRFGDAVYINTSAAPATEAGAVEILGSVYDAARRDLAAMKDRDLKPDADEA